MSKTATMTTTTTTQQAPLPVHQKSLSNASSFSISTASLGASTGSSNTSPLARTQSTLSSNQGTLTLGTIGRMGSSKRETPQDRVDRMLQMAGIPNPEEKSACMRAALAKGYYNFTGELAQLETVVWQGKCLHCQKPGQKATLRQLLDQPDDGLDYAQGAPGAVVSCAECRGSFYLTHLCTGRPERDTGKFHMHCRECPPGVGACTGNAQNLHCKRCQTHFDGGALGANPCACEAQQACCVVA